MPRRREFLILGASAGAAMALRPGIPFAAQVGEWVNDVHSGLNRTLVRRILRPESLDDLQRAIAAASSESLPVSICGGRHAMGGQQFGSDTLLLDMSGMSRILSFDRDRGLIEVGSGIMWPDLIHHLISTQGDRPGVWGIIQKQTGADKLTLGGSLAANIHGRGLRHRPLIADIEAFSLVDSQGELRRCSRKENADLFSLVIGGYGLFGVVGSVTLRLAPRRKIQRVVEVADCAGVMERFSRRVEEGYTFGDFQYSTDAGGTLLTKGVFSCYRPVDDATPLTESRKALGDQEWVELIRLGHVDRRAAFEQYAAHYLATSGQIYWSDTHQLSLYVEDYHARLGPRLAQWSDGCEMITEVYVPRERLERFLALVRKDALEHQVDIVYGTVRLIERDTESLLAWARESWACVIFNLHIPRAEAARDKTADDFRRLIDRGLEQGGSYYLTYHRWATRDQVLSAHPRIVEFLELKKRHDRSTRFDSEWHRHYARMFAGDEARPPERGRRPIESCAQPY